MDLFTKDDLESMLNPSENRIVSIYLPTHRKGKSIQQNPIRLKNLIGEAEKQLQADDLGGAERQAILAPVKKLLQDHHFWRYQSDGLAIFGSQKDFFYYRLPLKFDELVVVANRYHIKPLLELFQNDGQFYLLAISQSQIRLFLGTRYSMDEVDLEGVPTSLNEALWFDDPEQQIQFQTGTRTPRGRGDRPAIYHGHGVGSDDAKKDLLRYFQKVDKGLGDYLQADHAPLVLAGVDYLLPIYREANGYPYLLEETIEGNPDDVPADELHSQGWRLVEPHFKANQSDALDHFHHLMGADSDLAAVQPDMLVPAAYDGGLGRLFVVRGDRIWGRYSPENRSIEIMEKSTAETIDLVDFTAAHTIKNGGEVYVLPEEKMPAEAQMAGVLRYPSQLA